MLSCVALVLFFSFSFFSPLQHTAAAPAESSYIEMFSAQRGGRERERYRAIITTSLASTTAKEGEPIYIFCPRRDNAAAVVVFQVSRNSAASLHARLGIVQKKNLKPRDSKYFIYTQCQPRELESIDEYIIQREGQRRAVEETESAEGERRRRRRHFRMRL